MPLNLNVGEILLGALAPALESVVTDKLVVLFEKLHAHDASGHAASMKALYIGTGQLERLTDETKTKIDDAVVNALKEAIEISANEHGIELAA